MTHALDHEKMEVWNCTAADGGGDEDLISACNLTAADAAGDGRSVAGLRQLPRNLYTPTCRVYDFVMETILMGSLSSQDSWSPGTRRLAEGLVVRSRRGVRGRVCR